MTFLTPRQAAVHFGLSFTGLQKIVSAGLIPAAESHGGKLVIPSDVARRIAARSRAPSSHTPRNGRRHLDGCFTRRRGSA
ncbi:hypothetical protein GCM10023193_10290 [Planotetraspora kaengkrachanensis]|uniref:Helix-turn-helix domain-containing protein n=1 Tax=Planotetraspora kaengkrachanensis TaxID=575193 RepID=A0A8J3LVF7_9ACTN|nr:hypothetical protein Pka01_06520 [Planotetraspora kaengkrachanensis]